MKPDPDYIKRLLAAFQDSPEPATDINELEARGLSYETPEFYFHLRLLNDQGFVEREDGKSGLGVEKMLDGQTVWSVVSLRLTAAGHEFAEALNNSKAFEAVKKSLVSSSLSIMRDIAVAVLKAEVGRHGLSLGG
jgi:hypothetical protein